MHRLSSYQARTGLVFDEDTQSFVRLASLADVSDASYGGDDDEDEADATSGDDSGMTADDEDDQMGQPYDVRSLLAINQKLRTQVQVLQQRLDLIQQQREQGASASPSAKIAREPRRARELRAAGFKRLAEVAEAATRGADNELRVPREGEELVELAERSLRASGKRLSELSYDERLRLLIEVEREYGDRIAY